MDRTETTQSYLKPSMIPDDYERARKDAALFQHLIEGIKEYAIFMIDLDGKIATWNPGVSRLLGYAENDFIGKHFSIIFTPEDVKSGVPSAELKTARAAGKADDERWHRKKDGTNLWASGLVTLMKEPDGTVNGFTKIMRDQTEKKQFEQQLANQANSLAIANKELTNFAGIVSHDLKAPLQTVIGFANELKKQKDLEPDAEESVRYIVDGTRQMIELVNELLKYSTSVEQVDDKLVFVDATAVIQNTVQGLDASIKASGASVNCGPLPTVWTSAIQLSRIFQNLIENAIKYSTPGTKPVIKVSAKPGTQETVFSVEDNGRGISKDEVGKLFTLFERLHPEEKITGKGIGLATCRKIIERQGGRIWVTSEPGKGSIFSFSIPNHLEETNAPETPSTATIQKLD